MGARFCESGIDGVTKVTEGWGREPRGQTGVCGGRETDQGIAGHGRFLPEKALDERAFVVKWGVLGRNRRFWEEAGGLKGGAFPAQG